MHYYFVSRYKRALLQRLIAAPVITLLSLVPAACSTITHQTTPAITSIDDARNTLLAALSGTWDNSAQFSNASDALKVAPSVNGNWLDLQHAVFKPITAPAIGDKVLYLEWRNKADNNDAKSTGTISRQRIWSFKIDANKLVRMDFYAFVDGKLWSENSNFNELSVAALRGYGDACALYFSLAGSTYSGEITAKDCTITAASGRRMGINASVELRANGSLEYKESGVLDDGRFAFRVPPMQPYKFVKILK
jgi:hypothetical protein